ncbi:MAG: RHS repeat-associated core domain-containing protein, partial [Pseudonocardiaceae bacterium]
PTRALSRNANPAGWSYDPNGNETAGLGGTTRTNETYSGSDQLTAMTDSATPTAFSYAGLSNTERITSGSTSFQSGEEGLANQSTGGATTAFTRDPSGTLITERVGSQSYYYLFDGLGSVVSLVNATSTKVNSYTCDPYGQARTTTEAVANPNRFTGGYLDSSSGLYHFGVRYYDPSLGRWTELVPTGQNPRYTYASDDPAIFTNASGASIRVYFPPAVGGIIAGVLIAGGSISDAINAIDGPGYLFRSCPCGCSRQAHQATGNLLSSLL